MAFEQYANNPSTTLNGAINNSVTTVVVSSPSSFPSSPQFRILIDSELMLVTAISSSSFTVTRGAESTTAASHSNGATITGIITAGALDQIRADDVQTGADSSRPSASKAGRLYMDNDGPFMYRDTGSVWGKFGPIWNVTPAPTFGGGTWTWINNATGSAVADTAAGLTIYTPGAGLSASGETFAYFAKSIPSTPYTIDIGFLQQVQTTSGGFAGGGFVLHNSGGTKLIGFISRYDPSNGDVLDVRRNNSPTSFNSETFILIHQLCPFTWLRITDDGTTRGYYYSSDAITWKQHSTESHTNWITPDQIGLGIWSASAALQISTTVIHYLEH